MELVKASHNSTEPAVLLMNTQPGDCIHFGFACDTFEDGTKNDLFWLRVDAPEAKDRIRLVNLKDGKQLERDGDHRVVTHRSTLQIVSTFA